MTTIRRVWRVDSAPLQPCKRLDDGSVRCDALMTRTGIFRYMLPDGSVRRELRLPDDVFDGPALRSFDGRPITDDHPSDLVTAGTVGDVAVGAVTNPHRDDDHVRASLTVWNAATVRKMESGKLQLSGGYVCDTEETAGHHPVWGPFDARQVRIQGNHLAIVDVGRAGPNCRARLDGAAVMMLDADYAPPAPRAVPTELGFGDITDPDLWERAWKAAFAAESRIPEQQRAKRADAYLAAIKRVLTPALDRLRTRRTDAAPARSFFLPPPPSFPRLSPQPRTDTAMGKKNKDSAPKPQFRTESELMELQRRGQAYAGTGMRLDEVERAIRKSDKAIRKDREANAAAFAARRDAAQRFAPAYNPPRPRADVAPGPSTDVRAAEEALRRRSERQWAGPGNADRLKGGF